MATTSATLNGNLTAMGTADNVTVSFEYGTTSEGSYTAVAAGWKAGIGTFSVNLSGLTPGATYYYRAVADGDGDPVYGLVKSFTASTTPPAVTTSAASSLATTSATLNGNLGFLGTATSVTVSFQWGTTASYGSETSAQSVSAIGTFSANLTSLTANTTYHFRAKAGGHGSAVYGEDITFTTSSLADTTAPVMSLVNSTDITKTCATITWTTNEAATSEIEYGLTEVYGSSTTLDTNLVTSHSVDLTGLKAGKTYHYRVICKDTAGNQAVSEDNTFTTAPNSSGMPAWAWVLVGLGVVGLMGGIALLIRGRLAK
jgi:phosphodiesterase/alkaline phosphatase D-like protein